MIRRAIKGTIRPRISRFGFTKILIGAFRKELTPQATILHRSQLKMIYVKIQNCSLQPYAFLGVFFKESVI